MKRVAIWIALVAVIAMLGLDRTTLQRRASGGGEAASAPAEALWTAGSLASLPATGPAAAVADSRGFIWKGKEPLDCMKVAVTQPASAPDSGRWTHADVRAYLANRGIKPRRVFYLRPGANDRQGAANDIDGCYGRFGGVRRLLRPGDAVLLRGGIYDSGIVLENPGLSATADDPIWIMAFPGERPVIDLANDCVRLAECGHIIVEGLTLTNAKGKLGEGVSLKQSHHITLRNLTAEKHDRGIIGMQGLSDIVIENCVLRDNTGEHGIYLGCRDLTNENIVIRGCRIYRNAGHGIQHNGRVKNLVIEDNVIHTNSMAGISLLQGVCGAVVRNNLIFNNNKQGIIFFDYDSDYATIGAYDQNDNRVEHNTIWIGSKSWDGKYAPRDYAAIVLTDGTKQATAQMKGNAFRDNILVTCDGPAILLSRAEFAQSAVLEGNLLFRAQGDGLAARVGEREWSFDQLQAMPWAKANRWGDPKFPDVSPDYFERPEKFVFVGANHD